VNTSSGTTLDVDGDGHADVVATSRDARAFVFRGGPEGLSPTPVAVLGEPGCPRHDWVAAPAGDVDGDGYIDLVVGSRGVAVYLYRGGPAGIDQSPSFTMEAPEGTPGFARDVAAAGDVDGDGYGDFIVGSGAPVRGVPAAYLFQGSSEGPRLPPAELWSGPDTFGNYSVTGVGDVDGDGHGDVAVGALVGGAVRVYHGSPDGLASEPTVKLRTAVGTYYGWEVAPAGDVDGDGYADLLIGAANPGSRGRVHVHRGGPNGTLAEPIVLESEEGHFGFSTAGGDLDADGFADVAVGAANSGNVYIYRGAPGAGALGVADEPHTTPGGFAWPLAVVGDIDGDGNLDVAVGDYPAGTVYLFRGSPDGVDRAPQVLQVKGVRGFGFSVGSGVGG
jgi:hypothetical protein